MSVGNGAPGGVYGMHIGNCEKLVSQTVFEERRPGRPFSCRTLRGPRGILRTVLLLVTATALMLAMSMSRPAGAGQWQYTCKDGYRTTSSNGCNGHGGVKSKTVYPLCGDGIIDAGEACDDGSGNSDVAPNGCRTDCRRYYCGDGVIDRGEQCDDGSNNQRNLPNTCRQNCTLPVCGDGIVDDGTHRATNKAFNEACDDGNTDDSDGCTTQCRKCLPLGQMGNIEITTSTVLCPAQYQLDDYGDYGAIIIKASGVTLDCNGATLIGEGRGVGIVDFRSNDVVIKNCNIRGYDIGIRVQDARNVSLQGNTVCGNAQRDIELVDATDIHGYNPSMAVATLCVDKQVRNTGIARRAAVQQAPGAPRDKDSAAPSQVARIDRTAKMMPVKAPPAPAKPQGQHSSLSAAKGNTQSLYDLAKQAQWTSKSAKVVFGSDRVPEAGSVRIMGKGQLADGHVAANLLCTQPDWKNDGYIQGVYPVLEIGGPTHFQSAVAMLKGANPADAVSFDILIQEGRQDTLVKSQPLRGSRPITLDADLSRWQGKKIRLVLRTRRLKGVQSLPAVWVNPILVNVP